MNIKTIQKHPLFIKFSEVDIQRLLNTGKLNFRTFNRGQILHHQDELANQLEIILQGRTRIQRIDISGKLLTIATLHKNDIIGGHLLFCEEGRYSGDVIADQETVCLIIDRNTILTLCQANTNFIETYLRSLSENTQRLSQKIQETTQQTIRNQLITIFKKQYLKSHSFKIQLPANKKQLAQSFGVARTSVSRELKRLSDQQLIHIDGPWITLLSVEWIRAWTSK
ncbi:MAG: Crp/Fnr family transcriptional regulator [Erysipelothrix sp.]|nr:Crp/Fnr family transcriptional regulator [Erysipelothrix sp.]